jgi:hypothetical protein
MLKVQLLGSFFFFSKLQLMLDKPTTTKEEDALRD